MALQALLLVFRFARKRVVTKFTRRCFQKQKKVLIRRGTYRMHKKNLHLYTKEIIASIKCCRKMDANNAFHYQHNMHRQCTEPPSELWRK